MSKITEKQYNYFNKQVNNGLCKSDKQKQYYIDRMVEYNDNDTDEQSVFCEIKINTVAGTIIWSSKCEIDQDNKIIRLI